MINDKPSLDILAHYGVKGMKWGVRRAQKAQNKYAGKAQRQADMSNENARRLKSSIDSKYDPAFGKLSSRLLKDFKTEYAISIDNGKKRLKVRKDILNMDVQNVTSKDIKNRYKKGTYEVHYYAPFA